MDEEQSKDLTFALDLLQTRFEAGCYIAKDYFDDDWWLWDKDGNGVCGGDTVNEMLIALMGMQ